MIAAPVMDYSFFFGRWLVGTSTVYHDLTPRTGFMFLALCLAQVTSSFRALAIMSSLMAAHGAILPNLAGKLICYF
jgi:hypothetical protein